MIRAAFLQLAQKLAPTSWLLVVMVTLPLSMVSAWTLFSHLDDRGKDKVVFFYESIGRFFEDTVRLTFLRPDEQSTPVISDAVRIAPMDLLNPDATFNWISSFEDFVMVNQVETLPEPVAPVRLLDPSWLPL